MRDGDAALVRRRWRDACRLIVVLAMLAPNPRASLAQPPLAAARAPVLKQIDLPHAYYYREMYVPQVTSGPSAVTWSPDGTEIIYSAQGMLWRQRVRGTGVTERAGVIASPALQLTNDGCYDYQPDWSTDGEHVVYAAYCHDAIELKLLDLSTGRVTPLTEGGAVNVDARWSPDGSRLAWVSTSFNGRWHIFVASVRGGRLVDAQRITEDHESPELRRYYYSKWDHYLSPTWSPDGRELLLVSNKGRVHGTGGIWRMRAERGAEMREIRYEETNWKTHPDWSPDGKRVVYSSYLGRQWHQLWLVPSGGGDPFEITYGEFDATMPRWSRDATRIAYVSNEGGDLALRIVEVPGARTWRVVASERRWRGPVARVRLRVTDAATARAVAARVSITGADGRGWSSDDAWRHADEGFDRSKRAFEPTYFHTTGVDSLTLPAGRYEIVAWKGPEWRVARESLVVTGATASVALTMRRLDDLPARGWWGGDLHVHMNYGGAYRNTPAHLAFQARAEGLHVIEQLIVNKEQRVPDIAYFRTTPDPVSSADQLLMHAQEFHTSVWGHTALIGLRDHYVLPDYAGYVNTSAASLFPDNATVAALGHAQGALFGYVHPFDEPIDPFAADATLGHSLPIDAALGTLDYLEVMGYSDHRITSSYWYKLLDLGFRIPAGAGTDAFPNFASLRGPPGLVRVYAHAGARLEHRAFLDAVKRGRTFVTNGPLLQLTVDGREPGDSLVLAAGAHRVRAHVSLSSNMPLDHLELVRRGGVVTSIPLGGDRTRADTTLMLDVDASDWIVLRAWANDAAPPVLDLYPFASTSPVYVTVGGEPLRSAEASRFYLAWIDKVKQVADRSDAWNTPAERDTVLGHIAKAREIIAARAR